MNEREQDKNDKVKMNLLVWQKARDCSSRRIKPKCVTIE